MLSGEDPLDNSIYGPQAVNGSSQLAGPDQVLLNNHEKNSTMHRQLSEMSQYEGATLGQPSKSIVYCIISISRRKIVRFFWREFQKKKLRRTFSALFLYVHSTFLNHALLTKLFFM